MAGNVPVGSTGERLSQITAQTATAGSPMRIGSAPQGGLARRRRCHRSSRGRGQPTTPIAARQPDSCRMGGGVRNLMTRCRTAVLDWSGTYGYG